MVFNYIYSMLNECFEREDDRRFVEKQLQILFFVWGAAVSIGVAATLIDVFAKERLLL